MIFAGCKALSSNDRIIPYKLISPKESLIKIEGDFQKLRFFENDFINVMPAYYRDYGGLQTFLIVRIQVNKKYSFKNYGNVVSKKFGELKLGEHKWVVEKGEMSSVIYHKDLKNMNPIERKNKILNDTIELKIGDKKYTFTPSSTH